MQVVADNVDVDRVEPLDSRQDCLQGRYHVRVNFTGLARKAGVGPLPNVSFPHNTFVDDTLGATYLRVYQGEVMEEHLPLVLMRDVRARLST